MIRFWKWLVAGLVGIVVGLAFGSVACAFYCVGVLIGGGLALLEIQIDQV